MSKKFYILYETTNNINDKIYVGVHGTDLLEDGYIGTGKAITSARKKYGKHNFSRRILAIFDNPSDAYSAEGHIVDKEFTKREDTYNIKIGGSGGGDQYHRDYTGSTEHLLQLEDARKKGTEASVKRFNNDVEFRVRRLNQLKRMRNIVKEKYPNGTLSFKGKKHKEESKKKIGEASSKHQSGKGNSQYGTIMIMNEELRETKRIKKDELIEYEKQGWIQGACYDFDERDKKSKLKEEKTDESIKAKEERLEHLNKQHDNYIKMGYKSVRKFFRENEEKLGLIYSRHLYSKHFNR